MRTPRRGAARYLLGLFGLGVSLATHAHASLTGTAPWANERLTEPPGEIVLTFSEGVTPVTFFVKDRDGRSVGEPGPVQVRSESVALPLTATLAPGTYVVSYRVISADTHPVAGSFAFAVGQAVDAHTAAVANEQAGASAWGTAAGAMRALLYGSVMLAVGSALLRSALRWPAVALRTLTRQGTGAAATAAIAYVALLGFAGADITASSPFAERAWSTAARSTLGTSALLGVAGALLTAFGLMRRVGAAQYGGAALMLLSLAVTGHVSSARPVWLTSTSLVLHVLTAACWAAAFAPLRTTLRDGPAPEAARALTDFSGRATWLVAGLGLSGVVIAAVQLGSLGPLTSTLYGQRLCAKLAAVALLLALAAWNRWRLTPRLSGGDERAARALIRTIACEIGAMALVVVIAASLTLTPPPRALGSTAAEAAGAHLLLRSGTYEALVDVTPAHADGRTLQVRVRDQNRQPVRLVAVTLTAALPSAGIEPVERAGSLQPDGSYSFDFPEMIISGTWRLGVGAFITDFDKVDMAGEATIQ